MRRSFLRTRQPSKHADGWPTAKPSSIPVRVTQCAAGHILEPLGPLTPASLGTGSATLHPGEESSRALPADQTTLTLRKPWESES